MLPRQVSLFLHAHGLHSQNGTGGLFSSTNQWFPGSMLVFHRLPSFVSGGPKESLDCPGGATSALQGPEFACPR